MCSSILLGEFQPCGDDIDCNDTSSPECLCDGHAEETNRATSKDDDGLVSPELTKVGDGVDTDSKGLNLPFCQNFL